MLSRFRARLTFANVLSVISMFVVLGGGAYAASTLPNNSVGTEQIQRDGVTKPDVARDAIGPAELRADSIQSPDVKDGSLGCQDFSENAPVCQEGTPGPVGPQGPAGPGSVAPGSTGLTTTTARQHDETIELTCAPPQPAPANGPNAESQSCSATETAKAACVPGEVASGGSSDSSSSRSGNPPGGYSSEFITVTDDRPDPTTGTPSGWAADFKVDSFSVNYNGPVSRPPDPTVTIHVVCAS